MGFTCAHRLVDVCYPHLDICLQLGATTLKLPSIFPLKQTISKVGGNNEYLYNLKIMNCFLPKSGNFNRVLGS